MHVRDLVDSAQPTSHVFRWMFPLDPGRDSLFVDGRLWRFGVGDPLQGPQRDAGPQQPPLHPRQLQRGSLD